jgi:hypothetical protein
MASIVVPPRARPALAPSTILVPKPSGKRCLGIYHCGCRMCYHMDLARAIAHNALVWAPVEPQFTALYPWSDPRPEGIVVLPRNLVDLRTVPLPNVPHNRSTRAREVPRTEEKFPRAQEGELDERFAKKAKPTSKKPQATQGVDIVAPQAPQAPQDGEAPEAA